MADKGIIVGLVSQYKYNWECSQKCLRDEHVYINGNEICSSQIFYENNERFCCYFIHSLINFVTQLFQLQISVIVTLKEQTVNR